MGTAPFFQVQDRRGLHRSEVGGALGTRGGSHRGNAFLHFLACFGCRSLGKPLVWKSDKGIPVVTHGNSVVQRNALKICWNSVMQPQTNKKKFLQ